MGEVIGIDSAKEGADGTGRTLTGPAMCTHCRHKWQAVTPVGYPDNLECPECGQYKGIVGAPVVPQEFWVCHCGSDLFYLTPTGASCRACGMVSNEWAE